MDRVADYFIAAASGAAVARVTASDDWVWFAIVAMGVAGVALKLIAAVRRRSKDDDDRVSTVGRGRAIVRLDAAQLIRVARAVIDDALPLLEQVRNTASLQAAINGGTIIFPSVTGIDASRAIVESSGARTHLSDSMYDAADSALALLLVSRMLDVARDITIAEEALKDEARPSFTATLDIYQRQTEMLRAFMVERTPCS